jgi:hypothetical protein
MEELELRPLKPEEIAKMSEAEINLHFKKLELLSKQAEFQDIGERLAERKMKRENKDSRAMNNGLTLAQIAAGDEQKQSRCNHRKGGMDADALVSGQGTDSQYCVLKHRFANGDIWVRCLRCGKWWTPPVEVDFMEGGKLVNGLYVGGKLNKAAFDLAEREYQEALKFQTLNVTSGSCVFEFSDGGKDFRKRTRNAGRMLVK